MHARLFFVREAADRAQAAKHARIAKIRGLLEEVAPRARRLSGLSCRGQVWARTVC